MDKNVKKIGLYIHIPFCLHKCAYCDFCSDTVKDKLQKEAYVDALISDIEHTGKKLSEDNVVVDSIYVGGGTPSLLSKKEIEFLTDTIYDSFRVTETAEFTFEVNPATLDRSKAKCMLECGVNRLSIGLQSAHDNELRALSRIHSFKQFLDCYKTARRAGFENINVDVMYGIPEQTLESFMQTLETVAELEPEHISMYGLRIEQGTPFSECEGELALPDEDTEYAMYRQGREFLLSAGYSHYEISNYAKEGCESQHNLKYWRCEEYIGIGVAAHSFYADRRYAKITDTDKYIAYICGDENTEGTILPESVEHIDKDALECEYVMLGLRTGRGVVKARFKEKFGFDFDSKYAERIKEYADAGFMINNDKACMFSPEGMYVSNRILCDILDL